MNGWKISAIILLILLILESSLLGYGVAKSLEAHKSDSFCQASICNDGYQEGIYDTYLYAEGYCMCYKDGKAALTRYIG